MKTFILAFAGSSLAMLIFQGVPAVLAQQSSVAPGRLRVKQLVVVDDQNRERIVLEADANGGAEISLFNKRIRGRRWIAEKDEAVD